MFNPEKVLRDSILWTRNLFDDYGKDTIAVVAISGGKDSSITANICVEALGKERVFGLLLPNGHQHDIDVSYALIDYLGIPYKTVNIEHMVKEIEHPLKNVLTQQARYNIPARVRMTVAYAIAGSMHGRVSNNCNLSEDYIGWVTKFGDGAGDFSISKKLTATEFILIGKELMLPDKFLYKTPEDGLTGKSDEENFGFTYAVLDKYIRTGICEDKAIKAKVDTMHIAGLHKENESMKCFEYIPE